MSHSPTIPDRAHQQSIVLHIRSKKGKKRLIFREHDRLTDFGATYVSRALVPNPIVHVLYLKNQSITDHGATELAKMLRENRVLRVLNLSKNKICEPGATAIANALLKSNTTLRELYLSGNNIGKTASSWINATLLEHGVYSSTQDRAAFLFAGVIRNHPSLIVLDLKYTDISKRGSVELINALMQNTTNLDLSLSFDHLNYAICTRLEAVMNTLREKRSKKSQQGVKSDVSDSKSAVQDLGKTQTPSEPTLTASAPPVQHAQGTEIHQLVSRLQNLLNVPNHDQHDWSNLDSSLKRIEQELRSNSKVLSSHVYKEELLSKRACFFCKESTTSQTVIVRSYPLNSTQAREAAWKELSLVLRFQHLCGTLPFHGASIRTLNNSPVLVMELEASGSLLLRSWIRLELTQASECSAQVASLASVDYIPPALLSTLISLTDSICALHQNQLEHRALRPDRILVNKDRVLLLDFGVADDEHSFWKRLPEVNRRQEYKPPEAFSAQNSPQPPGSWDVYSLGVIFWECLVAPVHRNDPICMDKESGYFRGFYRELVCRMRRENASMRPTVLQVKRELMSQLLSMQSEYSRKIMDRQPHSRQDAVVSLRASLTPHPSHCSTTFVNRGGLVTEVLNLFSGRTTRELCMQRIEFRFRNETGFGPGVTRDAFNTFCEKMHESQLLVASEFCAFYSPRDDQDMEEVMVNLGRLLFYCASLNIPLPLRLSPLVYAHMVNQIPCTSAGYLSLLREFEPETVSHLNHSQYSLDAQMQAEACDIVCEKEEDLLGMNQEQRKCNIQHLCRGFLDLCTEQELRMLECMRWDDMRSLICGSDVITCDMILVLMVNSLDRNQWRVNDQTRRTREWLEAWLRGQDEDMLRMFLKFCTGLSTLPQHNLTGQELQMHPNTDASTTKPIRASTCGRALYLWIHFESKEAFCEAMDVAMLHGGDVSD